DDGKEEPAPPSAEELANEALTKRITDLHLVCLPGPMEALGIMLERNRALTNLDLSRNMLDSLFVGRFMPYLALNHFVQTLNMSRNRLDGAAGVSVAAYLTQLNLEHMDLSRNRLSQVSALALGSQLAEAGLYSLDISHNAIGDMGGAGVLAALAPSGAVHKSVAAACVAAGTPLPKGGVYNQKMERLNIGYCGLGLLSALALSKVIGENETLCSLDVSGNPLGGERGMRVVAKGCQTRVDAGMPALTLDVRQCQMDGDTLSLLKGMVGRGIEALKTGPMEE
ncbi:hypothetical protein KIPB_013297, partial [Kipferlia bialata]